MIFPFRGQVVNESVKTTSRILLAFDLRLIIFFTSEEYSVLMIDLMSWGQESNKSILLADFSAEPQ